MPRKEREENITAEQRITIVSAQGTNYYIEFHKTAYKCWHVVFPHFVDACRVTTDYMARPDRPSGDYTYTGPQGGAVLATSSLARAMGAIAEHICETEY